MEVENIALENEFSFQNGFFPFQWLLEKMHMLLLGVAVQFMTGGEVHTVEDHQKYSQQFSLESGGEE